jgi:hypothetical protein
MEVEDNSIWLTSMLQLGIYDSDMRKNTLVQKLMFSGMKNTAKHDIKWNVFSIDVFSDEKYGKTWRKVKRFQRWCFQRWKIGQTTAKSETFSALKTSIFSLGFSLGYSWELWHCAPEERITAWYQMVVSTVLKDHNMFSSSWMEIRIRLK